MIEEITNEGVVMTKNDEDFLPIEPQKINVFGWASTNPIYGGTGSGTVDTSTAVGILEGLENAGFETNTELSDMYREYGYQYQRRTGLDPSGGSRCRLFRHNYGKCQSFFRYSSHCSVPYRR